MAADFHAGGPSAAFRYARDVSFLHTRHVHTGSSTVTWQAPAPWSHVPHVLEPVEVAHTETWAGLRRPGVVGTVFVRSFSQVTLDTLHRPGLQSALPAVRVLADSPRVWNVTATQ